MSGEEGNPTKASGKSTELKPHPGTRPQKHLAERHLKSTEAAFATQHLLIVAMGGLHPTVEALRENPLDMIPLPTPDNPHYLRILMERSKMERENEKIRQSHRTLMLQYWTEIYNHLMSCCEETHPTLHDDMFQLCRLDRRTDDTYVAGGYADGPRAWQLYKKSLFPDERSEADCQFYEQALLLQKSNPLPANASASDFRKRALRFITDIEPNLPRKFEGNGAGEHILSLMPSELHADKNRLRDKFKAEGTFGDLRYVQKECEEVVAQPRGNGQPTEAAAPVRVDPNALGSYNVADLAMVCGMTLSIADSTIMPAVTKVGGATKRWCSKCGPNGKHTIRSFNGQQQIEVPCFADPYNVGTYSPAVATNPAEKKSWDDLHKKNAETEKIPYTPRPDPTAERIAAWKKRKAESDAKKKAAGEGPSGPEPASAAVDAEFFSGLRDLDDPDFGKGAANMVLADRVAIDDKDDCEPLCAICMMADETGTDDGDGVLNYCFVRTPEGGARVHAITAQDAPEPADAAAVVHCGAGAEGKARAESMVARHHEEVKSPPYREFSGTSAATAAACGGGVGGAARKPPPSALPDWSSRASKAPTIMQPAPQGGDSPSAMPGLFGAKSGGLPPATPLPCKPSPTGTAATPSSLGSSPVTEPKPKVEAPTAVTAEPKPKVEAPDAAAAAATATKVEAPDAASAAATATTAKSNECVDLEVPAEVWATMATVFIVAVVAYFQFKVRGTYSISLGGAAGSAVSQACTHCSRAGAQRAMLLIGRALLAVIKWVVRNPSKTSALLCVVALVPLGGAGAAPLHGETQAMLIKADWYVAMQNASFPGPDAQPGGGCISESKTFVNTAVLQPGSEWRESAPIEDRKIDRPEAATTRMWVVLFLTSPKLASVCFAFSMISLLIDIRRRMRREGSLHRPSNAGTRIKTSLMNSRTRKHKSQRGDKPPRRDNVASSDWKTAVVGCFTDWLKGSGAAATAQVDHGDAGQGGVILKFAGFTLNVISYLHTIAVLACLMVDKEAYSGPG